MRPFAILLVFLAGCYYDKEELLYPQQGSCNPVNVLYAADVKPILASNCYSCHSTQTALGNVVLDTHAGVQAVAANGKLAGAISHAPGFSPMPQGGSKLAECDIQKIKVWIAEGTKNN
jgi:hypothetical protein